VLFLRKNLSLGVHLLFALLCGRPVVVLAEPSNERSVARSVSHLHIYPKTREISCKQKVDKCLESTNGIRKRCRAFAEELSWFSTTQAFKGRKIRMGLFRSSSVWNL